jgi:hypothetical protein
MKHGTLVVVLAAVLGACTGPRVDVKPLVAAPHAMTPRTVEQLKVYQARPDGAVAVFDIKAYGDETAKLDAAVQAKAAALGCDGTLVLVRKEAVFADNSAGTGQLNEHHIEQGSHVEKLCIVLPAPAATPDAAPAATPAPAPAQ